MTINELRDFTYENHYKRIGFLRESSCYSMKSLKKKDLLLHATKLIEKIPDPIKTKKYYQSYLRRKITKLAKRSKIINQQLKAIENPNNVDIKSVIIEHPKTFPKLSKTIRQAEKVPQIDSGKISNSPLYSETKKVKTFLRKKHARITKRAHAFKGYTSSYNLEILNSFNPVLELKKKLIDLFSEMKGFRFVTTLVLEFKKIESDDKTKYDTFHLHSRAETIINDNNIDDVFESMYTTIISNTNIQKVL